MPCKIVKPIKYNSKEWHDYIIWRNYNFTDFRSIDSILRNSQYEAVTEEDFENTLIINGVCTDVISNLAYAKRIKHRYDGIEIEVFDFIELEIPNGDIVGYDILDGDLSYSLLTNFGNDIMVINSCLTRNGLIRHFDQVKIVHNWLKNNMGRDNHVIGSRIVAINRGFG